MQKITIELKNAPDFVLGLIKNGLTFEAQDNGLGELVITLTGGF